MFLLRNFLKFFSFKVMWAPTKIGPDRFSSFDETTEYKQTDRHGAYVYIYLAQEGRWPWIDLNLLEISTSTEQYRCRS